MDKKDSAKCSRVFGKKVSWVNLFWTQEISSLKQQKKTHKREITFTEVKSSPFVMILKFKN